MRLFVLLSFLLFSVAVFPQQTQIKSFSSEAPAIEVNADGIDEIQIINTNTNVVEVRMFDQNPNAHHVVTEDDGFILKIGFNLAFIQEEAVFRKYITKRLDRVSAQVYLPKGKSVTILGQNVDVISNSYQGDVFVSIHKGFVQLHEVQQNTEIKLFQGNVFAKLKQSNIDIVSNKGTILINQEQHKKKYQNIAVSTEKLFKLSSINANVQLTTE